MKTATIIAAFLFASAAAQAQENYAGNTDFVSTKTRAEVKAELRIAQERGEVVSGEQYPGAVLDAAAKGKTRAEVKAELAAYRKTHHETDYSSL
jgi:DNA transposition AAA+ family ATPase